MKHLTKDLIFPLTAAGNDALDIVPKYNTVVDKLILLEDQCRELDSGFDISHMWTCSCINGKLMFNITMHCRDMILKNQMLDIFWSVVN